MAEPPTLTFEELCAAEPLLQSLKRSCTAESRRVHGSSDPYCANAFWYGYSDPSGGVRGRLGRIIGWGRVPQEPPELCSQAAYDVAYDTLYALLPNCTHNGTVCGLS